MFDLSVQDSPLKSKFLFPEKGSLKNSSFCVEKVFAAEFNMASIFTICGMDFEHRAKKNEGNFEEDTRLDFKPDLTLNMCKTS
jgi:hypothetical protein